MTLVPAALKRRTRAETAIDAAFAAVRADLPGAGRSEAFARFATDGLPHRRIEAYHFTDLHTLVTAAPEPARRPSPEVARATALAAGVDAFAAAGAARFVLVDGWFCPDLSDLAGLGDGVSVSSVGAGLLGGRQLAGRGLDGLGERLADGGAAADPLVALACAFYTDGVVLRVAPGTRMARPLEIRHLASGASVSAHVRHLIVVGDGGAAEVLETHASPDGVEIHAHGLTEATIGAGATLSLVDRQCEGDQAMRFSTLAVAVADDAVLDHTVVTLGARLARTQVFARLGARTQLTSRGATLVRGRAHADATLVVDHVGEDAVSRELYKSAVDDEARSVFQGRIRVDPVAQGTDGRMGAHAVLLSDRAEAMAKPELEIFADDVACAHGATVGALDDALKFYLMSRGIPAAETEKLLIRAFLGEVTDAVASEPVRAVIEADVEAWIDGRERSA
ncbi:Fe-S cluster assembly protein SufD [Siculibacillus lacustris]|uniref:Fe-S cluster assembly protein SufD n=1 Tax=Siculibacillus lacustris TaxID=1549641 RepID=A0A4Q9VTN8_9HYPH|nr:Fe-S cluster assembly protein SufD [Siculibacillus lacustris]TBW38460.1 Fe-S cluster assembly protein SufD [Siculibacillus lacustris]